MFQSVENRSWERDIELRAEWRPLDVGHRVWGVSVSLLWSPTFSKTEFPHSLTLVVQTHTHTVWLCYWVSTEHTLINVLVDKKEIASAWGAQNPIIPWGCLLYIEFGQIVSIVIVLLIRTVLHFWMPGSFVLAWMGLHLFLKLWRRHNNGNE